MTEAKAREIAVAIYKRDRMVDSLDQFSDLVILEWIKIILSVPVDLAGDLSLLSKEQAQQILVTVTSEHPESGLAQLMSEF